MKKIITLFAIIGLVAFSSCEGPEGPPGPALMPQIFEIKNVNLGRVADNEYNLKSTFIFEIGDNLYDDESVLVYRLTEVINSTTPVWQLIPRTIYFNNGDIIDYYFDFSKLDFVITARGSFNLLNARSFIDNQTFRFVIVPANFLSSVNKNNYSEVMSALKLNENQVQLINL
ncbi:hypothetical protein IUY40_01440 [Flavobacterium sp. ALJ2]|uniref:hypothetical protein n=1 Tax=Flavobacterium sp. ALJ2 TaxID=2786960 RepID=UPI00189F7AFE|nr:hypothetical protein [Flavobacterium sp. ALJ2]MBF7090206.1 hypothetical protein [Flavobacterium sp. ALJ2]